MASPLCPCGSCMVFWVSSCPRLTVLNSACPHAHATLALAVTGLSAWAAVRARWHLPQYHLHYCWVASVQHGPPVVEGAACPKPVLSVLSPDQRAHGVLAHVEASAHREPPPYRCHGVDVLGVSHCSHGSKGHQESCFPSAQAYSPGEARPLLFPVPWEEVWTPPPTRWPKGVPAPTCSARTLAGFPGRVMPSTHSTVGVSSIMGWRLTIVPWNPQEGLHRASRWQRLCRRARQKCLREQLPPC